MTERGTDWSNFQPVPSPEDVAALLAAGFTFAIVGLQQPGHAVQQIAALRAGGVTVDDCYMESNPAPPLPDVNRIWVAVESGSGFEHEASIDQALAYVASQGKAAGIYTSDYMVSLLGLEAAFAGKYAAVLKWIASYDNEPSTLPPQASMKQYTGAGQITGIAYQLDLDSRSADPDIAPNQPNVQISEQGADVQVQTLNQADAIAAFNVVAARLGHEITGDAGERVELVTDPPPPAGYKKYLFTLRDSA